MLLTRNAGFCVARTKNWCRCASCCRLELALVSGAAVQDRVSPWEHSKFKDIHGVGQGHRQVGCHRYMSSNRRALDSPLGFLWVSGSLQEYSLLRIQTYFPHKQPDLLTQPSQLVWDSLCSTHEIPVLRDDTTNFSSCWVFQIVGCWLLELN
jgi:hypothetical protein